MVDGDGAAACEFLRALGFPDPEGTDFTPLERGPDARTALVQTCMTVVTEGKYGVAAFRDVRSPSSRHLAADAVAIVDTHQDLWVWIGRLAPAEVRAAAHRRARALMGAGHRGDLARTTVVTAGAEPALFRALFKKWRGPVDGLVSAQHHRNANDVGDGSGASDSGGGGDDDDGDEEARRAVDRLLEQSRISGSLAHLRGDVAGDSLLVSAFSRGAQRVIVFEDADHAYQFPEELYGHFYDGDCFVLVCVVRGQIEADSVGSLRGFGGSRLLETGSGDVSRNTGAAASPRRSSISGSADATMTVSDLETSTTDRAVVFCWVGARARGSAFLDYKLSLARRLEARFSDSGLACETLRIDQFKEPAVFWELFPDGVVGSDVAGAFFIFFLLSGAAVKVPNRIVTASRVGACDEYVALISPLTRCHVFRTRFQVVHRGHAREHVPMLVDMSTGAADNAKGEGRVVNAADLAEAQTQAVALYRMCTAPGLDGNAACQVETRWDHPCV